jgi:hypothetical protein
MTSYRTVAYRSGALALATCAASLSVAACSAGITTASSATTSAPAPTRSASVAAAASSPASSGHKIAVSEPIGSFPAPAGAKEAENVAEGGQIIVMFSSVTPAKVYSFYTTALPQAGYTISSNSLVDGGTVAVIEFSGHGYKGGVSALSKAPNSGPNVPGLPTKNVTTIIFSRD